MGLLRSERHLGNAMVMIGGKKDDYLVFTSDDCVGDYLLSEAVLVQADITKIP